MPTNQAVSESLRDLVALCTRLVRRLQEKSPEDPLVRTATDYLNTRRYITPRKIKFNTSEQSPQITQLLNKEPS